MTTTARPEAATWIEYLTEQQCWDLLAASPVGRIGVVVLGRPEVYPVNHVVDRGAIVFRTDPGTKLAGLAGTPAVCFEADGVDPATETGWSVLLKGHAAEVLDAADRARLAALPIHHWGLGPKAHVVRITPAELTGRRIHHGDELDGP
jgi:nitroimidazol reductase NimA-like FMN-containing flavoprotein (pyridoxamine 5'-phosphate oxidase superfamily)